MNPFKSVTQRLKRILWFLVFSVVTRHASLAVEGAYGQTLSPMTEFPEPFAGLEAAGRAKWAASLPDERRLRKKQKAVCSFFVTGTGGF